jgi:uncharacterized membrane protein YphA (DoxX/SURF4 family)
VALRIIIGWHFLYEGLVKLGNPAWSAAGYLEQSNWILAGFFHWIAASPGVLSVVDFINIWGQILIGLGLFLGLLTKISAFSGAILLGLYYLAIPPFIGSIASGVEGNYMIIDKNLIEAVTLLIIGLLPTGIFLGLDKILQDLVFRKQEARKILTREELAAQKTEPAAEAVPPPSTTRRELLKHLATLPVLGFFGLAYLKRKRWESQEEQNLVDVMSGASVVKMDFPGLDELKGKLPYGKIRDTSFSKLILGGNLLNGYAHSRDLIYVSHLITAYHTKERIFQTLMMAEKCGINTLLTDPIIAQLVNEYWDKKYGKIQFASDCVGLVYTDTVKAKPAQEWFDFIKMAIDKGAAACYIQGETADYYFEHGDLKVIEKAMQIIRDANIPAGLGAHHIETIKKAVANGFKPDFWMKTLHHHDYWSANAETWHDNMYCFNPPETIAYMKTLEEPWIAFKVMAAGSIHPNVAFRYAWENGADFVCAGIYDFQMVADVNIALDVLNDPDLKRERPWRA